MSEQPDYMLVSPRLAIQIPWVMDRMLPSKSSLVWPWFLKAKLVCLSQYVDAYIYIHMIYIYICLNICICMYTFYIYIYFLCICRVSRKCKKGNPSLDQALVQLYRSMPLDTEFNGGKRPCQMSWIWEGLSMLFGRLNMMKG